MTPTAPELLAGCVASLSTPPAEEDAGAFMAGKVGMAAILALLCAQEAATGTAARAWENASLKALFAEAAPAYDGRLEGALANAAEVTDADQSLAAFDAANATLRRLLIRLHEAAEAAGDAVLDRRILAFHRRMAARRDLVIPPSPPPEPFGDPHAHP